MDDFESLTPYQQFLVMADIVRAEYGHFSADSEEWCLALLQVHVWAILRRKKLASIQQARGLGKEHSLLNANGSPWTRPVTFEQALRHFEKAGITFSTMT